MPLLPHNLYFRTDDLTRWGLGTGALQTAVQYDLTHWNLHARIVELEDNPPAANGIASITQTPSLTQLVVWLDDGSSKGPFDFPIWKPKWSTWLPSTGVFEFDFVIAGSAGVFLVLQDHVTAETFDPDAETTEGLLYHRVLGPITPAAKPPVTISTTSYTLLAEHANSYLRFTHASGCVITVPENANLNNVEFDFRQCGGPLEIVEGETFIVISGIDGRLNATDRVGAVAGLKNVGVDTWDLYGLLAEDLTGTA